MHIGQYASVTFYLALDKNKWRKLRKHVVKIAPMNWSVIGQPTRGYVRFTCYGVENYKYMDKAWVELMEAKLQLIA